MLYPPCEQRAKILSKLYGIYNMRITVLCVGKKHDRMYLTAIEEFQKRVEKYITLHWEYVPTSNKSDETTSLLKRVAPEATVVLLDERGSAMSTMQLSDRLEAWQNQSVKQLTFVIGGAHGVEQPLMERAQVVMSVSSFVLPHQLVRAVLIEQLYRCYEILNGGKYHHD